jgi:hypothetical protein
MTLNTIYVAGGRQHYAKRPTSLVASTNSATIIHMYIPFMSIIQYIHTYACMYVRTWPLGPEFFSRRARTYTGS